MKRKLWLVLAFVTISAVATQAQQARDDIRRDVNLAASNYVAYRGPQKSLTATPKGYEPYYISHYGRHGSRYLIGAKAYDAPYHTLLRADSLALLSAKGREVLDKVRLMRDEAEGRDGELTVLGAQQHQQIACRMYERFPEVFAGKTHIDAKSTIVIRCILSMGSALQTLTALNPSLDIRHDASYHDMYYMNDEHSPYIKLRATEEAKDTLKAFNARHTDYRHLMATLFTHPDSASWLNVNALGNQLMALASNIQSTELRHQFSMWDIFTPDEIYDYWQRTNAFWYMYYGPSKETHQAGIYTQSKLLRNIIATADSCTRLTHPGATLRFAHESCVMPLVCLLNLNGYGNTIDSLEELDDQGWNNYDIYPMGCNVQFVFYKPKGVSPVGADILVKVLLNEDEATLPISTDRAPYYHWRDVRAYLTQRVAGK